MQMFDEKPIPPPAHQKNTSKLKHNVFVKFRLGDSSIIKSNAYPIFSVIFREPLDIVLVCTVSLVHSIFIFYFSLIRHLKNFWLPSKNDGTLKLLIWEYP